MTILRTAILATGLAFMSAGTALAVSAPGHGDGYYGSAMFSATQGMVVGPYATYAGCNDALQFGIDYRVTNWGWTVESLTPCSYRRTIAVLSEAYGLHVLADSPDESGDVATGLLSEATRLRDMHRIDDYDRAVGEFIKANQKERPCDSDK